MMSAARAHPHDRARKGVDQMNVGRMSLIAFVVFVGIAGLAVVATSGGPAVLVPYVVVWLASFAYAMYLWIAVMRYGDRRLVKRGTQGTAKVLTVKETSWAMSSGEYEGIGAPSVWKYGLQVKCPARIRTRRRCNLRPSAQWRHRARACKPAQLQARHRRPQSARRGAGRRTPLGGHPARDRGWHGDPETSGEASGRPNRRRRR